MKTITAALELITPCFCGGAQPEVQAEVRAPSIRGQLRWWFRILGGFKSLASRSLPEQENFVFGFAGSVKAESSRLLVRVRGASSAPTSVVAKDAEALRAGAGTDLGYLLFPLQRIRRAVFEPPQLPRFELQLVWRGEPPLGDDLQALVTIYGHLGSLGFRSRRAFGALAFQETAPPLAPAFQRFTASQRLIVKKLAAQSANDAVTVLARWLRGWRAYSRIQDRRRPEPRGPGFKWAKSDHDAAYQHHIPETYRPALGLPIHQHFSTRGRPVEWRFNPVSPHGEGRFASPVILRPYRAGPHQWQALVIFVDSRQWPAGKKVFIDGQPRPVTTALYQAMKHDSALSSWGGISA